MLRQGNFKYIHYVDAPPQLFDLANDPSETVNLAADPAYQDVLVTLKAELSAIVDPDEADRLAKSDQAALLAEHGGREAVLQRGTFINSPVPGDAPRTTAEEA